jgi:hypothetical protein
MLFPLALSIHFDFPILQAGKGKISRRQTVVELRRPHNNNRSLRTRP